MTRHPKEADHVLESASMDQVRELLFGAQLKDMETRARRQEERFLREIGDVRDSLKSRLDSLENFLRSESGSLLHRLQEEQAERESAIKTEQRERAASLAQLAKELASTAEAFERKIAKLSGALDTATHELRGLLMAESNSLSSKLEERYQDALRVLSETAVQIRHDLVYRSSLSSMFTEVAVKLSGRTMGLGQLAAGGIVGGTVEDDPEAQDEAEARAETQD
jgi:signal transduction histidine kinase